MSPLAIEIALHYHARAKDYPDLSPPAQQEIIDLFLANGFLVKANRIAEDVNYKPTTKLHAYCAALCEVPEPEKFWVTRRSTTTYQD